MGGKILIHDPEKRQLHAQMDKKLFGNVLGDRSKMEIQFAVNDSGETSVYIYAYPLNAVGQKLMFGKKFKPGKITQKRVNLNSRTTL